MYLKVTSDETSLCELNELLTDIGFVMYPIPEFGFYIFTHIDM